MFEVHDGAHPARLAELGRSPRKAALLGGLGHDASFYNLTRSHESAMEGQ